MEAQSRKRKPTALVLALAIVGGTAACSGETGSSDPDNIIVDDGGTGETPSPDASTEDPGIDAPGEGDAPADDAPAEEAPADEEPTE